MKDVNFATIMMTVKSQIPNPKFQSNTLWDLGLGTWNFGFFFILFPYFVIPPVSTAQTLQFNTNPDTILLVQNTVQSQKQDSCDDCEEVQQAVRRYRQAGLHAGKAGNNYHFSRKRKTAQDGLNAAITKFDWLIPNERGGLNFRKQPLYNRRNTRYLICD